MKRTSFKDMPCSIARTMDAVGEWWSFLILRDVFYGIRRFEPLRRNLDISRKVLADRLGALVRAGVLERRLYQQRPPRHEYRLTPRGFDLFPILMALTRWGDRWLAHDMGRPVELVHARCGQVTVPTVVCSECGEELGAHNVRPKAGPGLPSAQAKAYEHAAGRSIFLRAAP